ncbi:hypothetical protein [Aquabacterium sp. J223]|uniref:hypothetical protein n=1 Tax=Aquabacterium sp. J223 TaxID=2898431 RepID=UPI0021AD5EB7|nr:hypothetical protein [Aquabacterium sp. J223]UUX96624.1 hypothetical protein LRS07_04825 [Aquabacterium sp. J223]
MPLRYSPRVQTSAQAWRVNGKTKSASSRTIMNSIRHLQTALVATASRPAAAACVAILALVGPARPAGAADGCLVLLCLAAPSWRAIPQCVPPVKQVLRDLARGKPFPACVMAGAGNSASHAWASAPASCPPQYTRVFEGEGGPIYTCDYTGAVSVTVNGTPFSRTWWTLSGETVTEFSPAAKAQLGTWDTRFDDDYAAWLAALPPPAPTINSGY